MRYGFVATNLLDLWAEPRFNSERASQLLFCELLTILDEQQGYFHVRQTNGYTGWADSRHIVIIDEQSYQSYLSSRTSVVKAAQAPIRDKNRQSVSPHMIYYGTLLKGTKQANGLVQISLPDGQPYLLRASSCATVAGNQRARKITGSMLVSEARRFLGVPYLWGGVSPCGFDCSGLVQTVCRRFGLSVPRDTKDQITIGTLVPREQVATGDLLFFNRHVGFAIGKDRIIHSSIGGSGVRINSLRPEMPDYREDLDRDFNQARRIV